MFIPLYDTISMQLVYKGRARCANRVPIHCIGALRCIWGVNSLGNSLYEWGEWVAGVAVVCFVSRFLLDLHASCKCSIALTHVRLYIIEGLITVLWAFCCIFLVPKNYETAYFLNEEEKKIMRLRAERAEAYSGGSGHYGKQDIKEAAKDVKSWLHGIIQISVVTILYGFGTFLPIIIKDGFQYSTVQVCSSSFSMSASDLIISRHNT
jgi:hypothetical protein